VSIDADAVAAATIGCRWVAGLSPGPFGDVASYLPHRRIVGVRVTEDHLEVRIVALWGPPLSRVGEEVRAAVRPVAGNLPVEVFIDDIEFPSGTHEAVGEGHAPPRPQMKGGRL
jgi:hypothetical protein